METQSAVPWLDRSWFTASVTLQQAEAYCSRLARSHYENFTVLSFLIPRPLRQDFANVYAYCRVSDDLADEIADPREALERLDEWGEHLARCYRGEAVHPVFVALSGTIRKFDIPIEPFADLLVAFRQDQVQTRYRTWEDLLGYCRNSANPVGRLVLYLAGYRDATRQELSDATCTALQLVNFWQDVARDYARGRVYVPQEILAAHGYTEEMLARREAGPAGTAVLADCAGRTRPLFDRGLRLRAHLRGRLRLAVELFSRGGLEVLRAIETECRYDTLHRRPEIGPRRKALLIARTLGAALAGR